MGPLLSEEPFERGYEALRRERTIHTKDRARERRFVEAVDEIDRSGAQWRLLPAEDGEWYSVYKRFARWADLGVWERLLAAVADDPDLQAVMRDATVVRAHACAAAAPRKKGSRRRRGEGGRTAGAARSAMCWSMRWGTRCSAA